MENSTERWSRLLGFISTHKLTEISKMKAQLTFPSFEWCVFNEDGSVDEDFYLVKTSCFATNLKRFLNLFDRSQIHIVNGFELKHSPWSALKKVENFLGVKEFISQRHFSYNSKKGFYCLTNGRKSSCLGENKGRRHPNVTEESREALRKYFLAQNRELNYLIGSDIQFSHD